MRVGVLYGNNAKLRGIGLFIALFLVAFLSAAILSQKPAEASVSEIPNMQNSPGAAYDGVDFSLLMNGSVYFGAIKHAKTSSITESSTTREINATPILWKVIGEDGTIDGQSKDGAIALYSKYVVEYTRFSWTNNATYEEWSGEADYDTSFVSHWLNATGTYNHTKMHGGSFRPINKWGFANSFLITEDDSTVSYDAEYDAITKSVVSTYFIAQGKTEATSETVVTNPGDIYQHLNGSITQGEWTSYFGGNSNSNRVGWPVTQSDVVAYIPFGVWSRSGQPSHNTTFYNANGLPRTNSSEDYSIGVAGSDVTKATTKYGNRTSFWLRNPNGLASDAGSTYTYYASSSGGVTIGTTANGSSGIRPITKLDPEKVIMTHEIVDNKTTSSQVVSDRLSDVFWNYDVGLEETNYKLTLLSDDVELNELHDFGGNAMENNNTLHLDVSDGMVLASNNFVGDYLAYKIVENDSDGNRKIVAYGTSKDNTDVTELHIDGIMNETDNSRLSPDGDYTLYVWAQAEDCEGNDSTTIHSFEGSQAVMLQIIPNDSGDVGTGHDDTYKVIFDGNGNTDGLAPIDDHDYASGDIATILDPGTLIKDGNLFVGWNTEPDGAGILYKVGSTITITDDLTLYAQWEPVHSTGDNTDDNTDDVLSPPDTGRNKNSMMYIK